MAKRTIFCNLPEEHSNYDNAWAVILPVPYDGTSTYMKGADKGPDALIEASTQVELYDIETDSEPYLAGIYTDEAVTESSSPETMAVAARERAAHHLGNGKFLVTLGGEHSISIGPILAHCDRYEEVTVLQLDAHADLRQEYHGSRFNHACVMARVKERAPIVQVGIRSMDASEKKEMLPGTVFFAHEIVRDPQWIDKAVAALGKNVYITIDLDVFDPSFLPGTGTPEPGGLSWYDVTALLKEVTERRNVVGFDVVELCPGVGGRYSEFTAAKLVYKLLAYRYADRSGR